jgi:hypothetical protein
MRTSRRTLARFALAVARRPAVHFLVLGALLFVLRGASAERRSGAGAEEETVVVTTQRIAALSAEYERNLGSAPSAAELDRLVGDAVEEELLFREGLRRGLHRNDASVRERLVQAMAFASPEGVTDEEELHRQALDVGLDRTDLVVRRIVVEKLRLLVQASVPEDAADDELSRFLAAHRDTFRQPELVSFRHVFFSSERRGEREARAEAARASAALAEGKVRTGDLGDPFLLGHEYGRRSRRDLEKAFGAEFCAAVFALAPGGWSGPIPSAHGFHLVRVEERLPERDPPLGEVRSRVVHRFQQERRRERLSEFVAELRKAYPVHVEAAEND